MAASGKVPKVAVIIALVVGVYLLYRSDMLQKSQKQSKEISIMKKLVKQMRKLSVDKYNYEKFHSENFILKVFQSPC